MKKLTALLLVATIVVGLAGCAMLDYSKAQKLFENGDYEEAKVIFEELEDYEDSQEKVQACDYAIAEAYMEDGEYKEAAELFETLGEYEDSQEKAAECRLKELDALLQGTWVNNQLVSGGLVMEFDFKDGRVDAEALLNGKSMLTNTGDYRISTEDNTVYITYDYTIGANGEKTKNEEEKALFAYAYDNGEFKLLYGDDNYEMEKE